MVVPYFGMLSVNRYKIPGTRVTRAEVRTWMDILASQVKGCGARPPIRVKVQGLFRTEHKPDIHNLHKVIGDAIEKGLGINDRHFVFDDQESKFGYAKSTLEITLQWE